MTEDWYLPPISFLEAWAHSYPAESCGPCSPMQHTSHCVGSSLECHSTTTSQTSVTPRHQTLHSSAQNVTQTTAAWEGEGAWPQYLFRTANAKGGAPLSSQDTPTISHRKVHDGIFKRFAKDQIMHLSLIIVTEQVSAFRKDILQGKEHHRKKNGIYMFTPIHQGMS